jgi:hypothetical protein
MTVLIKNLFEEFERDVHELAFYEDIVQESYSKYLFEIKEYIKNHSSIDPYSSKRTVYFDILNKHEKIVSDLKINKTFEQTSDDIFFHYNKQMQWFLVEAYEIYEKFIENLYSLMGYLNNDFWNLSDFGEIQFNDISNKNRDWFFEQIKNKKDKPYSIIKVFEKRFNLKKYFDKENPNLNYYFLMQFISEFRHAIVHNKGFLNKTFLKDKLFKKQGINGKELMKKYEDFIYFYYDENKYGDLICLTTVIDDVKIKGLPINYNRRLILTQYILSYSNLLTQMSIRYLKKNKDITK